jgi:hypothetical protein
MTLSGRTKLDCYALSSPGMRRSANYRSRTRPAGLEWERRLTATQGLSIIAVLVSAAALCGACLSAATEQRLVAPAIFDSDPSHIWNRTYGCLFVRRSPDGTEYGAEALDPLLWWQTRYLLTGDSHRNALACLDEFLHRHAERAVQDPLKRAILQRDLWAVFDWAAAGDDLPQQRRELEMRLAEAIRRVAITPDQVRALPDTYADAVAAQQFAVAYDSRNPQQAFLPPELLRPGGPWVCLSANSEEPTANGHFTGRSRFLVFMRLPDGSDATRAYVQKLRSSSEPPLLLSDSGQELLNLALPQFPVGTQVALVQQAIVIDSEGKLLPTALTESVQLRVYHAITPGTPYRNYHNGPSSRDQDFFEFRMSRSELFAHRNGGLVAVHPREREYTTFSTQGNDPFESTNSLDGPGDVLERCRACHSDSGIQSVESRLKWMNHSKGTSGQMNHDSGDDPIGWETDVTIARKRQGAELNLLQRLWRGEPD